VEIAWVFVVLGLANYGGKTTFEVATLLSLINAAAANSAKTGTSIW